MGDYLAHHGIKGMKWGIRRFQNEDGTRTPEGLKRYSKATRRNIKRAMESNDGKWYIRKRGKLIPSPRQRGTIIAPSPDRNDENRRLALERQKEALKSYDDARREALSKSDKMRWDFYEKYKNEPTNAYYDVYSTNEPEHKERTFKENGIDEKRYNKWVKDYENYQLQQDLLQGPSLVYNEMYTKYARDHADEWLSATLKDIGIEDTQKGRDLLKKMYPNITR